MCYLFAQALLYCAVDPVGHGCLLSHCVWLWIICYDGWTCLVTSCPDVCQSRLSVNRNVEKDERKCPWRPCSHTQIRIIMIPHGLFVYVFRDLFLICWSQEKLQSALTTLLAILDWLNQHSFNEEIPIKNRWARSLHQFSLKLLRCCMANL